VEDLLRRDKNPKDSVKIAIVGKYVEYEDSYKSLNEALYHGGLASQVKVELEWVESEDLLDGHARQRLESFHGILVPGGFGKRGNRRMLCAVEYARTRHTPFFGICLGMECAVIEFARNVCGLAAANSSEFDRPPSTGFSTCCAICWAATSWAATCGWARSPAKSMPNSLAYQVYQQRESRSGIATGTSSTGRTSRYSRATG